MPSCFVPGCTTGNGRGHHGAVHLFKFPRKATADTKMNWESNIPKREDRKWNFSSSQLCHLHFEDKYIEKVKRVMMGSVVMAEEPRKQWTLPTDAVPTIFSNRNVPKYFDKKVASRRPPKDRTTSPIILDDAPVAITEVEVSTSACTGNDVVCVNFLQALHQTPLPPSWVFQNLENSVRICNVVEDKTSNGLTFHVEKFIEVYENHTYEIRIRGKAVSGPFDNLLIKSALDLQNMISQLTQMELCRGAQNCNMFKKWPSAHKILNVWYSDECEQSTLNNTPCIKCSELKETLVKTAEYALKRKQNANSRRKSLKLALNRKKNKASRLKTWRLRKKNLELKSLQKKFLENSETNLEKGIQKLENIPDPLKLAMITAVRNAKAKSKKGYRYTADWLMYALLLKVKSPKGYRHARDTNMIPLPSPAHLSRLIRGIPCQFGFSDFVFMALEKQYKNKPRRDRQFVLLFDEMKVKEAISFDKTIMKFMGFIDYGEFSSDYKAKKGSKKEADHCLVFMARCVNSSMTQPIAAFATRGAAPGNVLAKMILSCIVRLEAVHCEVIGVTCDGATTNKSAWKFLGISGENGNVINKIVNPVDESRNVYFFSDIPHIIKCVRNHLHKQGEAKFSGKRVSWGFYRALYDTDKTRDLRLAPKLTYLHINPGPFQKMVVSHAVQVFSSTVSTAIKFYREVCKNEFFKGSEGTEEFTKTLNDVFDSCNARAKRDGIRPLDEKFMVIQNFLSNLCQSDTFASDLTLASIRVTLRSILDVIVYLCNELGFDYVLTGKFNQDCLEKFFGLLRSFGGDNSHPTATSFSHIFRLLSIYCPTSTIVKGNVRTNDESAGAITSYVETLNELRLAAHEKNKKVHSDLEDMVLQKIMYSENDAQFVNEQFKENQDHTYGVSQALRCIIYNLTGFVVYKAKSFTRCLKCLDSLEDDTPTGSAMTLTAMKDLGGLKYPCRELFVIIQEMVEPELSNHIQTQHADSDFVQSFFEKLGCLNAFGIGCCEEHSVPLLSNLVIYYVTIRLWFHSRNKNREELKSGTKTKNKMKEGKLA